MKYAIVAVLIVAVLLSVGILAGQTKARVTFVDHAKVAAAASGEDLAKGSDFTVMMMKRTGVGHVEVHDKETDTFYVLDGSAILVTGGTMAGGHATKPNQQQGSSIQGGQTYSLTKGDVIVIPAGTPHWFKQVPKSISYYVVKIVK